MSQLSKGIGIWLLAVATVSPLLADGPAVANRPPAVARRPQQIADVANLPQQPNFWRLVLGGLFGRGGPAKNENPPDLVLADDEPTLLGERGNSELDAIDMRLPHHAEAARLLLGARRLMNAGEWDGAVAHLRRALDEPRAMVRLADGRMMAVYAIVHRLLMEFPPDALNRYRRTFDGAAARQLEDAVSEGNIAGVVNTALQYFHTTAGYDAANWIGSIHFDRGEFELAAVPFLELSQANADLTRQPEWRRKAVFAVVMARGEEFATSWLREMLARDRSMPSADVALPTEWQDWLHDSAAARNRFATQSSVQDDWPVLLGNASRRALASGDTPMPIPLWERSMTGSEQIRQQIHRLTRDLQDEGRATIPASFAMATAGRVAVRTFRGVSVLDVRTGETVWDSDAGLTAEQILGGEPVQLVSGRIVINVQGGVTAFNGGAAGSHPLASLLYRDSLYGVVSCDDHRVFVLEDHGILSNQMPGVQFGGMNLQPDPLGRDWSSNRLTAYDLVTGHPRWQVGGEALHEPFDLPLAGTCFLGAPLRDGDELLVIGERDREVRLFALDPDSGQPKWSCLLAVVDTAIGDDLVRRFWCLQPSVERGIIYCPTGLGWLAAVDRTGRSLLWAARYTPSSAAPSPRRGNGIAVEQMLPINSRWCVSAPIVSSEGVIFTPQEESTVVCARAADGTIAWQKPKEDLLYCGGVVDGMVLLVGNTQVQALDIRNGEIKWAQPLDVRPSGQGIAAQDRYYIPLQTSELLALRLSDGEPVERVQLPAGQQPLGNLLMHRGMVVSLSPTAVTAFEQHSSFLARVEKSRTSMQVDVPLVLDQAEASLASGDIDQALAFCRQAEQGDLSQPAAAERHRRVLMNSLIAQANADPVTHQAAIVRLRELAASPTERLAVERLEIERLLAAEEFATAFNRLWDLYRNARDHAGLAGTLQRADNPDVSVRLDRWLAGQLADLWQQIPPTDQPALIARLQNEVSRNIGQVQAAGNTSNAAIDEAAGFWQVFRFSPQTVSLGFALADQATSSGRLLDAERILGYLRSHSVSGAFPSEVARESAARLAQLCESAGLPEDSHGRGLRVDRKGDTSTDVPPPVVSWQPTGGLTSTRSGMRYTSNRLGEPSIYGELPASFSRYRWEVLQNDRLNLRNAWNDDLVWTLPLRSRARSVQGRPVVGLVDGHQLVMLHQDVLHCLSMSDRQLQWTMALDDVGANDYYRHPSPNRGRLMLQANAAFLANNSLPSWSRETGMLATANQDYVCVLGRRELRVLDATDGRDRWSLSRVASNVVVVGSEDRLYVMSPDLTDVTVYRAEDGRLVESPHAVEAVRNAFAFLDEGFVQFLPSLGKTLFGLKLGQTGVQLVDPETGKVVWKVGYPVDSRFATLGSDQLLAVTPTGECFLLDLHDGAQLKLGAISRTHFTAQNQFSVVADAERIYLAVNGRNRMGFFSENLPSIRVNGPLYAFDRHGGGLVWEQAIESQDLIVQHFAENPVLLFSVRTYERRGGRGYRSTKVVAIEKQTGRMLAEEELPSTPGFHELRISMSEGFVELRSYNERLRLSVKDEAAEQ